MSFLSKTSKALHRQQEKLMQKLGKAEETVDEEYDEFVLNFNKQQNQASRLYKESQNYIKALKGVIQAAKSFGDAVKTVYEPDWPNSDATYSSIHDLHTHHIELQTTLTEQVVEPLNGYLQKFPDIKTRMAKRDRKVIDFDRCRRAVDTAREKNSAKLPQVEKEFTEAEKLFTEINDEVHQLLPSFYNNRVSFYASVLQTLYATESTFHQNSHEASEKLRGIMDSLLENQSSMGSQRRNNYSSVTKKTNTAESPSKPSAKAESAEKTETHDNTDSIPDTSDSEPEEGEEANRDSEEVPDDRSSPNQNSKSVELPEATESSTDNDDVIEMRIATHNYDGQDEDELTFTKGALIEVIPFKDPDDEDDGWLNGRIGDKSGVFPVNHTSLKE